MAELLHTLVLEQYDHLLGLDLGDLSVDGCITKAACGGDKAGRSPVDRGTLGLKRSTITDATTRRRDGDSAARRRSRCQPP